jgi:NADH:ubiquinone oxidoreductase subunit E
MNKATRSPIIDTKTEDQDDLIPLLQKYQKEFGYISEETVREISQKLNVSENHIFGVASFYSQFRFHRPGRHMLRICLGTACHVQGGKQLANAIKNKYRITHGETTQDQLLDYEEVACLGCCAQASVVEIDGKIFGKMTTEKLSKKMEKYE